LGQDEMIMFVGNGHKSASQNDHIR